MFTWCRIVGGWSVTLKTSTETSNHAPPTFLQAVSVRLVVSQKMTAEDLGDLSKDLESLEEPNRDEKG